MKLFPAGVIALGLMLATSTGCRRHADAKKAELGEAGYQFTPEDWFRAARGNDVAALKKFVTAGFPAASRSPEGDVALHFAAGAGAESAAGFLLDRNQEIDARGAGGRTPLMAAVIGDRAKMVRWLLRQGADPKLKDDEGFRPLMLAVREGSEGAVGELAPCDREDLDSALLLAAMIDKGRVIDVLTSYGASVHARMDDGRTPLMVAAQNGNLEAAKILLEIGASRLALDADGRTAEELAIEAGHADLAALISRDPLPGELALDTPETIAGDMERYVDQAGGLVATTGAESDATMAAAPDATTGAGHDATTGAGHDATTGAVEGISIARATTAPLSVREPAVALGGKILGGPSREPPSTTVRTTVVPAGRNAS